MAQLTENAFGRPHTTFSCSEYFTTESLLLINDGIVELEFEISIAHKHET